MYSNDGNQVFATWTPDKGGGPPTLWEYAGHLYSHRWLAPNVAFLEGVLELRQVEAVLGRTVDVLAREPEGEIAARVLGDLPRCADTLEKRCAELPRLLATVQTAETLLEWTR